MFPCLAVALWMFALFDAPALAEGEPRYRDMIDSLAASESTPEQESRACGPKCLFIALRLCGWDGGETQLEQLVRVGPEGTSMASLQAASERLGIQFECKKCSPAAFDHLPLPAIAHMEPSDQSGFGHYVVVIARNDAEMRVFDPGIPGTVRADRASFLRAATGLYLVPADVVTPWWVKRIWLAAGCFCGLAWTIAAAYKAFSARHRRRLAPPALLAAFFAAMLSLVGCDEDGRNDGAVARLPDTRERDEAKPLLEVTPRTASLGVLDDETPAVGRFTIRNTTPRAQPLALGRPTCNCLDVKLLPGRMLAPNATATVVLSLKTLDRTRAGFIEGSVQLARARSTESYELRVEGLIEGIVPSTYTVRRRELSHGLRDLIIRAYTREANASIVLERCAAYDAADTQAMTGPEAVLTKAVFGAPSALSVGCFLRTISVPMELSDGARQTSGGWLHLTYRLAGHVRESRCRFFVIASEGAGNNF